jgi:NAD-dependent deacetylase
MSELTEAAARLAGARRIAVLTGAGVSRESGLPTFREAQTGLWARYRPEDLASERAFRLDPARVWAWYRMRRDLALAARPNPAHEAIAELQRRRPATFLATQNVDRLHQRAGSAGVVELHGDLIRCRRVTDGLVLEETPEFEEGGVPTDPATGALLRPNVVWFGEPLPEDALEAARAAFAEADAVLIVGTSGAVFPASGLAHLNPRAFRVEVNPEPSAHTGRVDALVPLAAGEGVPRLLEGW